MLSTQAAKRYAQGLLEVSQEKNSTETVFNEMLDLRNILQESKELRNFLNSPIVDTKEKLNSVDKIFNQFSDESKNLIKLVVKNGRTSELSLIAQDFINKVEDMNGVQRITLTSAAKLNKENIENILSISSLVDANAPYDLQLIVNPSILGGYILRVGDQQIDASVRSKLNNLKKEFQNN